jgi:hypothetical protein
VTETVRQRITRLRGELDGTHAARDDLRRDIRTAGHLGGRNTATPGAGHRLTQVTRFIPLNTTNSNAR